MENNIWKTINNDISSFIEKNILPNIVSFGIARLFYMNYEFNESLDMYYNSFKSLVNIVGENKYLVKMITANLLRDKYDLLIIQESPLTLEQIKR